MLYKVVIVDDEPLAIEVLKHYLKDERDFTIINTFASSVEALSFLNNTEADVLFLDINMAVINGIELLKQLKKQPHIVFTTAYKQYLQEGFDHGILDYLQKPIKYDRLKVTLERIQKLPVKKKDTASRIHIRSAQREFFIRTDDILFFKAAKDYCLIYLQDGTKEMAAGSLKVFLQKHDLENDFVRVHKSYVVPVKKINEIYSGGIIQIEGNKIPIGRKYKQAVMAIFQNNLLLELG